ncbi:site-specific integrase [Halodesulfovibrio sp. MK-HDV]|jgi:integrase|uniref:tyrosine-type recombinase/integrase n=1 Tax=Halodesulfovibrio sp. MK-HDV TaxID=2599925 RepID=UPI001367BF7E|nr:site-specific integrase [Halodesulfovibrio sp. MK-HDV]KAF1075467.1 Tyrosine recombinase XerC [Halodesulfovibrio sp. MK-HDV]
MSKLKVKTLRFPNGERLPVLLNHITGRPEFYPNLYAVTMLRQRGHASESIARALREIKLLLDYFSESNIDVMQRVWSGKLFVLDEIAGLGRYCQQSFKGTRKKTRKKNVHFLDTYRDTNLTVESATTANRLKTIRRFLRWAIELGIRNHNLDAKIRNRLRRNQTRVLNNLEAQVPMVTDRGTVDSQMALDPDVIQFLYNITDPDSPHNPWKSYVVRWRNAVIIQVLIRTGIRRGELLGLKIDDLNFQDESLLVARRPDDPEDPRLHQPKTKTKAREKALTTDLVKLLYDFVIDIRNKVAGTESHPYIFISSTTGRPLAATSYNDIFIVLRKKIDQLPKELTGHICRHTYSTNLAEIMYKKGHSEATIERMLCIENGWRRSSKMTEHYTQKKTKKLGKEASLTVQDQYNFKVVKDEDK